LTHTFPGEPERSSIWSIILTRIQLNTPIYTCQARGVGFLYKNIYGNESVLTCFYFFVKKLLVGRGLSVVVVNGQLVLTNYKVVS